MIQAFRYLLSRLGLEPKRTLLLERKSTEVRHKRYCTLVLICGNSRYLKKAHKSDTAVCFGLPLYQSGALRPPFMRKNGYLI